MDERSRHKACGAQHKAGDVGGLEVPETGDERRPDDRAHGLHGKQHAHPVAGSLIAFRRHLGGAPAVGGHRAVRIGPHEQERRPAEELHQPHRPERRRRMGQQLHEARVAALLLRTQTFPLAADLLPLFLLHAVELGILLRVHLLHLGEGEQHAQDEQRGTRVEAPLHRVGHHTLGGGVAQPYPREEDGEQIAEQRAGVAEERLYRVGRGLLLLVHHVAHHHLERLHGHVDAGVEEDEREQPEPHGGIQPQHHVGRREVETAGIGQ